MLDELVTSLLYEGYALYPYTPGATKNATPTPFGIVYPPAYAEECEGAFDHARLECLAVAPADAAVTATLRYLVPSGERHEAVERHIEIPSAEIGDRRTVEFDGGRFTVRSERTAGDGEILVRACVHNTASVGTGLDRAAALRHALISTHIILELSEGRFVSPLKSGARSVNIWPVLASPDDGAILGATIILPDHPQLAPESRLNLFDNTEIEEALVLHVQSLSDAEREAAAAQDPAVREMLERAMAVAPEEIVRLHGLMKPVGQADDNPGEPFTILDGVRVERGSSVILRPGTDRDVYDRMLHGRRATVERIYIDYDDRVHLAVTVDDDPGQDLMREAGRYLFFFGDEVQTT